jgi:hypothetical protein
MSRDKADKPKLPSMARMALGVTAMPPERVGGFSW